MTDLFQPEKKFYSKKTRLLLMLLIGIGFLMLDALLSWPHRADFTHFSAVYLHFREVAGALLLGAVSIYILIKIFDPRPAFIIDDHGIINNVYFPVVKRVYWSEIAGVASITERQQKIIVVKVVEPNKFLATRGFWTRKFGQSNLKRYGSPIVFNPLILGVDADQLMKLISDAAASQAYKLTVPLS